MISVLLVFIISGLIFPVYSNGVTISVEPRIIDVIVSRTFTVDIWIREHSEPMNAFSFTITWDPTLIEYVSHSNHVAANGWIYLDIDSVDATGGSYTLSARGADFDEDASWATITFHCLGAGSSPINIIDTAIGAGDPAGEVFQMILHLSLKGAVNQNEPAPVGGISTPINKLEILTPYIALAGLIAVVSAVYVIKRRKD